MRAILNILSDLWGFLRQNKKWWVLPLLLALLALAVLVALFSSPGLAPFIYRGF
jgi:hypothetical protein